MRRYDYASKSYFFLYPIRSLRIHRKLNILNSIKGGVFHRKKKTKNTHGYVPESTAGREGESMIAESEEKSFKILQSFLWSYVAWHSRLESQEALVTEQVYYTHSLVLSYSAFIEYQWQCAKDRGRAEGPREISWWSVLDVHLVQSSSPLKLGIGQ